MLGVTLRPGRPEDAKELGTICYDAFTSIASSHNYPSDFPNVQVAIDTITWLLSHPRFFSVVAEKAGKAVGSNFLDERAVITGVGPITVDPSHQDKGAGRELMLAVMRRSNEIHAPGIRLVQVAYHRRSLALYAKLGFETREPLSNMTGQPFKAVISGRKVRKAEDSDTGACNSLCEEVHGFNRAGELQDVMKAGAALVVESGNEITGYSTGLSFFGHSIGQSNEDIMALIAAADSFGRAGFHVPTRNGALLRWCLQNGLKINQQMTLMTVGLYNEPKGAYLPSIAF